MNDKRIRTIVIVGGGTAGWMTATALSRVLKRESCSIRLIESDQIGTVGVGEATIPAIHDFNRRLGIDEKAFMKATNATFKLGIEFVDWHRIGTAYMHPFGPFGQDINGVGFHHYWLWLRNGGDKSPLGDYSLPTLAAKLGNFDYPSTDPRSVYSTYSYAFHFDATRYALFLRELAESLGVIRTEGKVVDVARHAESGFIKHVQLEDGTAIAGDLFIDCSGFRGLLIGDALKTPYEDWQQYLPCDSALAVQSENIREPLPYTRATARGAGWQWRIPLQHRTGNGHVFSSQYMSEEEAARVLLENLEEKPHGEPRLLRFVPGKRKQMWVGNCVAIGLSGGFLEPLESTSIYLIQAAIMKLIEFFPDKTFAGPDVDEFNRRMDTMFDEVRNFVILHYKATERNDTAFWRYCREMPVPDELSYRMELFRERGLASHRKSELFIEANWLAVLLGQGIEPMSYDPRVHCLTDVKVRERLSLMREYLARAAETMCPQQKTIHENCASGDSLHD